MLHRLLDVGDKVVHKFNCARVEGMDKRDGVLLVSTRNVYIIDDYRVTTNGEVVQHGSAWGSGLSSMSSSTSRSRRWPHSAIVSVFKRKYLLQPVAIEIFAADGRNYLLVFDGRARGEAFKHLQSLSTTSTTMEVVSGILSGSLGSGGTEQVEAAMGSLDALRNMWRSDDLTTKWVNGQVSNFQYLIHLNTLAGRSYNDLTQYPVFPWVIADYVSGALDLSDPSVYRDLSKPMGALSEGRAEEFRLRYEMWEPEENAGVPKWHYGSHYSVAGVVLYYLIRLEPFTQHFLKLQDGHFDVADRLFYSVADTWHSASGQSMNLSDVKELIPEFYYLPEMLSNSNRFDLGRKQTSEQIGDVVLPPWAHGDPIHFVNVMRSALESKYVSENLHKWIDLIFGCRQQGEGAEESLNVFYYLTYEGAIDIQSIQDPVERAASIAQINNFGQTPSQLFKRPHPQKQVVVSKPQWNVLQLMHSSLLQRTLIAEAGEVVGSIRALGEKVIMTGVRKFPVSLRSLPRYVQYGFMDCSVRLRMQDTNKTIAALEAPHTGQVSCISVTEDGHIMCTGGKDCVINVTAIEKNNFSPLGSLCAHVECVTCIATSRAYSIAVSGSADKTCIVWDLNKLKLVRQLKVPGPEHDWPISLVDINPSNGNIFTVSGVYVNMFTINGQLLVSHATGTSVQEEAITAITYTTRFEWLEEHFLLLTGHYDGSIRVWRMRYRGGTRSLHLEHQCKAHTAPITSLLIHADQHSFYSADNSGRVLMWAEEKREAA
eukprot:TRINITY_DN4670_c1_g1_i1.p1 TRINITY_DN4670_c1_g1~~TRINITY_DN4670_c1_g1_i1.p1  ORF type:complete len:806 (-),score=266.06 TRINITY_DN4670_c1_g1_i1:22-2325(-)